MEHLAHRPGVSGIPLDEVRSPSRMAACSSGSRPRRRPLADRAVGWKCEAAQGRQVASGAARGRGRGSGAGVVDEEAAPMASVRRRRGSRGRDRVRQVGEAQGGLVPPAARQRRSQRGDEVASRSARRGSGRCRGLSRVHRSYRPEGRRAPDASPRAGPSGSGGPCRGRAAGPPPAARATAAAVSGLTSPEGSSAYRQCPGPSKRKRRRRSEGGIRGAMPRVMDGPPGRAAIE